MGCQKVWQNCNQRRKDSSTDFLREDQTESYWQKEAEKEAARGTGDTQAPDPVSREAPEQKNREQTSENVKIKSREAQEAQIKDVQIQKAKRQKAVSDAIKTKEQKIRVARETPRIQNGQELSGTKQFSIRDQSRKRQSQILQDRMPSARNSRKPSGSRKSHGNSWSRRPYSGVLLRPPLHLRRLASSQSRSSV